MKPFVKWAGGKTQLLATLMPLIPENFNDYYEPFVGGGALLFKLKPRHPHINDMNKELLSAYRCFTSKKSYEDLMRKIDEYVSHHSEGNYLEVRALDQNSDWLNNSNVSDRAARMIYLNKSCFNGLYRVNSKGYFNVPSGKKKVVNAYSKENFNNIYQYFKESQPVITSGDFEEAVKGAKKEISFILIHLMILGKIKIVLLLMIKKALIKKIKKDYVKPLKIYLEKGLM